MPEYFLYLCFNAETRSMKHAQVIIYYSLLKLTRRPLWRVHIFHHCRYDGPRNGAKKELVTNNSPIASHTRSHTYTINANKKWKFSARMRMNIATKKKQTKIHTWRMKYKCIKCTSCIIWSIVSRCASTKKKKIKKIRHKATNFNM